MSRLRSWFDLEATFRLRCEVCEIEFFSILGGALLEDARLGGPVYTDCPGCGHRRKCEVVAPEPEEVDGP